MSFNGTQSRVVIGLLIGHNTLRRHLYIMGLIRGGADKSLARPNSRFILLDGENISFDASLVLYIYIYIYY